MMVLSGLKGEIGMSRKSVTEKTAQSHIYGQALTANMMYLLPSDGEAILQKKNYCKM